MSSLSRYVRGVAHLMAVFYCLGCQAYRSEEKHIFGTTFRCLDCETVEEMCARERREDGE